MTKWATKSFMIHPAGVPTLTFLTPCGPPFCSILSIILLKLGLRTCWSLTLEESLLRWFLFLIHYLSINVTSSVVYVLYQNMLYPKCVEYCLTCVIIPINWELNRKYYYLVFITTRWSVHCYPLFTMGKLTCLNLPHPHGSEMGFQCRFVWMQSPSLDTKPYCKLL